jgi:hypothetical protein
MTNQTLPINDSFCALPWVHQMVRGDGKLKLCCVSHDPVGNFNDMEADWNNQTMRDVRASMIAGRPVEACRECMVQEKFGKQSFRHRANDRWTDQGTIDRIYQSIESGFAVEELPKFLDIRFGNLCNLVCKMCHPANSTQIEKDHIALKQIDPIGFKKHLGIVESTVGYDAPVTDHQWEMFDRYIPHITQLYLAGGEPTLSKNNIRLLKRCVELGRASSMGVSINTNITNVNTDLLEMLSHFGHINIVASLDGVDRVQEYIRYPSKWSAIAKNLNRIAQWISESQRRALTIAITVQTYNILDLPQIMDRFLAVRAQHNIEHFVLEITNLVQPSLLSVEHTSSLVKAIARARLQQWWSNTDQQQWFIGEGLGIDSLLNRLDPNVGTDRSQEFLRYSSFVDQNKAAKLETHLPELHRLLTLWT